MFRFLALSLAPLLAVASPAVAAPGDLDPAFGVGGQTRFTLPGYESYGGRLRVAPDGRISADFGAGAVHFAGDGRVEGTSDIPNNPPASVSVRQADGKTLLARGTFNGLFHDARLERRNPDGSLDGSFGQGGIAKVATYERVTAITSLPQGGVALLLRSQLGSTWVVRRLDERGGADLLFGSAGRAVIPDTGIYFSSLAAQGDRGLLAIGELRDGGPRLGVVRLVDGAHDESFGTGGRLVSPVVHSDIAPVRRVLVRPDGRVVLVATTLTAGSGTSCSPYSASGVLFGFDARGVPDTLLGTDGVVIVRLEGRNTMVSGAALDDEGRILLGGRRGIGECPPSPSAFVARLTELGELDPSFGSGGIRIVPGVQVSDVARLSTDSLAVLGWDSSPDFPHILFKVLGGGDRPESDGDPITDVVEEPFDLNPRIRSR